LGSHLLNGQIEARQWRDETLPLIKEMGKAIELASICGLGRSVPVPLLTAATFFEDDVKKHLSPEVKTGAEI
ncbi:MAG: NADH-ubiquinone oxidoreductase-F iron-sulfur binding region, partial [Verrucomicrobiota bacterium]